jgi:hypothetical protein
MAENSPMVYSSIVVVLSPPNTTQFRVRMHGVHEQQVSIVCTHNTNDTPYISTRAPQHVAPRSSRINSSSSLSRSVIHTLFCLHPAVGL